MAYYNYKRVRDAIPKDFREEYERKWQEESGREFEGTADYDGDLWCMAADYIEHLQKRVAALESTTTSPGAGEGTER